eukprot:356890-Chlamydomonas_euryale.AAC.6
MPADERWPRVTCMCSLVPAIRALLLVPAACVWLTRIDPSCRTPADGAPSLSSGMMMLAWVSISDGGRLGMCVPSPPAGIVADSTVSSPSSALGRTAPSARAAACPPTATALAAAGAGCCLTYTSAKRLKRDLRAHRHKHLRHLCVAQRLAHLSHYGLHFGCRNRTAHVRV